MEYGANIFVLWIIAAISAIAFAIANIKLYKYFKDYTLAYLFLAYVVIFFSYAIFEFATTFTVIIRFYVYGKLDFCEELTWLTVGRIYARVILLALINIPPYWMLYYLIRVDTVEMETVLKAIAIFSNLRKVVNQEDDRTRSD